MIVDLSKWNGKIDWDKLAPELDFAILKATGGELDPRFAENATECNARGVPFHSYHFMYARDVDKAEEEAAFFWNAAHGYNPISYVVDVEGDALNDASVIENTKAFIAKLRALGAECVGIYTGDWAWRNLGFNVSMADWIWIARYGANTGDIPATGPSDDADLWQYTSNGSAPGVSTRVDLSRLQWRKPMSFFTGRDKSMAVIIGSARGDENGGAHGGKPGDQTGKEVSTQNWYNNAKGWRVFRAKNAEAAEKIAWDMQAACDNPHIGYDQYDRLTLYDVAEPVGFDCAKVETDCETDCSALVRVCCAYAGVDLPNFNTETEPGVLLKSGAFVELTGSKYTDSSEYLRRGDILDTATKGHTVVVLTDGPKAYAATGDRILRRGDKGDDVAEMQRLLILRGFSVGPDGADGDFGANTEKAVRAFQAHNNLIVDGECGPATWKALWAADARYTITIHGVNREEMEKMKERWPDCEVVQE